jgi:hypothetical protein
MTYWFLFSRKMKRRSGETLRPVLQQVQKFIVFGKMPSQKKWRRSRVGSEEDI